MLSLLAVAIIGVDPAKTLYSHDFRVVSSGPPNYVVNVTSSKEGPTHMDLFELGGDGTKKLITSTKIDSTRVYAMSVHSYKQRQDYTDRKGVFHKSFPTYFIALKSDGQYGQSRIFWYDPKTMRPVELLDALMGDVSKLDKGRVVEHSFTHYVARPDWPKGVRKAHGEHLQRTWSFHSDTFKFVPGKWQKG